MAEPKVDEKLIRWIAAICLLFFLWRGDPWAMKLLITLGIINGELVTWIMKK